ncbi:uncharacterized protein LOC100907386 [Galendromus occidentalis]|uniref:Uncharacterized protein LOC100907386 n=1 Tax=Galendromus occidentalis TaxID=34638 RepID=A0AAJ6VZC4_9ACAR|nr:uncharacterized protein LOC100907386 [Galendromus occidentalis]
MRTFAIIVLCSVAACANAWDMKAVRECAQEVARSQSNALMDEVNRHLDKVDKENDGSVVKAREDFEEKTGEFMEAMSRPLSDARKHFDDCVTEADGLIAKGRCHYMWVKEIATEVLPAISEATVELVDAVNRIVTEFRENTTANFDELRERARGFAKETGSRFRDCFSE